MSSRFSHVEWWGDAVEGGVLLLRYVEDGRIAVSLNVESPDTYLSGSHDITSHEFWDKPARGVENLPANLLYYSEEVAPQNPFDLLI